MKKTRAIILIVTLAAIIIAWYSLYAKNFFYESIVALSSYLEDSETGMLLFVLLAIVSAMISPFSSAPLVPIVIVAWGPLITALLLLIGWTIGGIFSYFIGKKFGYSLASKLIPKDKIDGWSRQIERRISIFFALAFRIMTPSETGYIFGIIKYPFWKYIIITFVSELPFAFALSYAGDAIISREKEIFLMLLAASIIFITVFYFVYRKEFGGKSKIKPLP